MYIPTLFREDDLATLHEFMQAYSFATVVTVHDGKPFSSHLPLYLDRGAGLHGSLVGHMALANPQWEYMQNGCDVLVMFHGPHAYVSPAWYAENPMVVPTWNYMAVHASGKARILQQNELVQALHKLVEENESSYIQPWRLDLTEEMREKLLGAIVGFEVLLSDIEGKFKLSQNRVREDQIKVIAQLETMPDESSRQIAEQMNKRLGVN